MGKKLKSCGVLVAIFVVALIGFWIYLDYIDKWYKQVQVELPEVKSQLTNLNHATLFLIPPPSGVIEVESEDWGLNTDYWYGVTTNLTYNIKNPDFDVQAYYQSLLERLGWKLTISTNVPQNDDYRTYFFKGACVQIKTYGANKESYRVLIYQDFEKQDFSPKLPPMWYMKGIKQYGKTVIATCP